MKEYTITFYGNEDQVTRTFRLINVATFRARSLMKQFYKIEDGNVNLNSDFLSLINDTEDVLNELMVKILVGDHSGISWFDADADAVDTVMKDFFSLFAERIAQSAQKPTA